MSTLSARLAALKASTVHYSWAEAQVERLLDRIARKRAHRGLQILEWKEPGAGQSLVLESFDVNDPSTCALGQTYGKYERAPLALKLFSPFFGFRGAWPISGYRQNRAWRAAIYNHQNP